MVLSRVRELVCHPGKVVNKAYFYDLLMEAANLALARQTFQILVKYTRSMKNLFNEIYKILPPCGTPKRMLDPSPPESPTATLYEIVRDMELVPAVQTGGGPS